MKAVERVLCGLGLVACLLAATSGCDDTPPMEIRLLAAARWNEDPGSTDEIGYAVDVDIGFPGRSMSCFPLSPDLRVTVNDREPMPVIARADCEWDVLVTVHGFTTDTDISVKLHDGDRLVGKATFVGMFPGYTSWGLVSPADGRVRAGEPLAIATSTGPGLYDSMTVGTFFHWLDMTGPAPPFSTFVAGKPGPDRLSAEIPAPPLIGRALLVVRNVSNRGYGLVESCTGFSSCESRPDSWTIGPTPVEVIP